MRRERARAGQRRAEANAFLVAERHDLDGVLEPLAARRERFDDRQRRERAVISVVAAGVAHRVDMRAEHQRGRSRAPALVARDDIAGRVDPRLEAGLGAPADERLRRPPVRVGEKQARQASRLVGEGGEGLEPRHQLPAGREIGLGQEGLRHRSARSSFSQRARTARSSSVICV